SPCRASEAFHTRQHLLGGATREGEQQNALRRNPLLQQMPHAHDERARFAGAGTRNDEQRAVSMRGGGTLFLIQLRCRSAPVRRSLRAWSEPVDARIDVQLERRSRKPEGRYLTGNVRVGNRYAGTDG